MSFVLPEVTIARLLEYGIQQLRKNPAAFNDIFAQYVDCDFNGEYGQAYVDKIRSWFFTTKVPVVQAWSLNPERMPAISVTLANESEDESKAAVGDYMGQFDEEQETGTAVFTVFLDIGIHANRQSDEVLWLYYIVSYILFKHKLTAERMGLKLQTYSASDYHKEQSKMPDNTYSRWIRFKCTTENFWGADQTTDIEEVNVDPVVGLPDPDGVATSPDVDLDEIDLSSSPGMQGSPIDDFDDDELEPIG